MAIGLLSDQEQDDASLAALRQNAVNRSNSPVGQDPAVEGAADAPSLDEIRQIRAMKRNPSVLRGLGAQAEQVATGPVAGAAMLAAKPVQAATGLLDIPVAGAKELYTRPIRAVQGAVAAGESAAQGGSIADMAMAFADKFKVGLDPVSSAVKQAAPGLYDTTFEGPQALATAAGNEFQREGQVAQLNAPQNPVGKLAYDVTGGLAQMSPALATTALTKNPALGAAVMAGVMGGQYLNDDATEGADVAAKVRRAVPLSAAEFVFSKPVEAILALPVEAALKSGAVPGILKTLLKSSGGHLAAGAVGEGVEESATQALQEAYDAGVLGKDTTLVDALKRIGYAGLVGAGAGAAAGGIRAGAGKLAGERPAEHGGEGDLDQQSKAWLTVQQRDGSFVAPDGTVLGDNEAEAKAAMAKQSPETLDSWIAGPGAGAGGEGAPPGGGGGAPEPDAQEASLRAAHASATTPEGKAVVQAELDKHVKARDAKRAADAEAQAKHASALDLYRLGVEAHARGDKALAQRLFGEAADRVPDKAEVEGGPGEANEPVGLQDEGTEPAQEAQAEDVGEMPPVAEPGEPDEAPHTVGLEAGEMEPSENITLKSQEALPPPAATRVDSKGRVRPRTRLGLEEDEKQAPGYPVMGTVEPEATPPRRGPAGAIEARANQPALPPPAPEVTATGARVANGPRGTSGQRALPDEAQAGKQPGGEPKSKPLAKVGGPTPTPRPVNVNDKTFDLMGQPAAIRASHPDIGSGAVIPGGLRFAKGKLPKVEKRLAAADAAKPAAPAKHTEDKPRPKDDSGTTTAAVPPSTGDTDARSTKAAREVRSDQGEGTEQGRAAEGGEDLGGQNRELASHLETPDGEAARPRAVSEAIERREDPALERQAEEFEADTGIAPYVPDEDPVPLADAAVVPESDSGTRYSIKQKGKYKTDTVTGLPKNKDGTVTVYFHTTTEHAREINRTKKIGALKGERRIHVTNESAGWQIEPTAKGPGARAAGAVVKLDIDPRLLQGRVKHANGRKDFWIATREGKFFDRKMRLWAIKKSRNEAISSGAMSPTIIGDRIAAHMKAYAAMSTSERKAALKKAREVMRDEHNVGTLLGENGKLQKTRQSGYELDWHGKPVASLGLGLSSAQKITDKLSTCPNSAICEGLCLGETSGNNLTYGGQAHARAGVEDSSSFRAGPRMSQYLKTEALIVHPEEFSLLLHDEIRTFQRKAKYGLKDDAGEHVEYAPAIRLNVTSDFAPKTFRGIIEAFPDVMFYDYTKLGSETIAPNHHLTYSSTGASQVVNGERVYNAESNWKAMRNKLDAGKNVAMAFSSKAAMPKSVVDEETGKTYEVWDGDTYDARFVDPKRSDGQGWIIGLKNKAGTLKETTATQATNGFFVHYDPKVDGDKVTIPTQSKITAKLSDLGKKPTYRSKERTDEEMPDRETGRPTPQGDGLDDLRDAVAQDFPDETFTPERLTGLPGEAVERIGALFGKKIVTFRSSNGSRAGGGFDGVILKDVDPNTIYLNVDSEKPHVTVAMHEMLHAMEATRPDLYEKLRSVVEPMLQRRGAYARESGLEGAHADVVTEEMIADLMADHASDPQFWSDLQGRLNDRSLWRQLVDFVKRYVAHAIDGTRPMESDRFVKDFEKIYDLLLDVNEEYARRPDVDTGTGAAESGINEEPQTLFSGYGKAPGRGAAKGGDVQPAPGVSEGELETIVSPEDGEWYVVTKDDGGAVGGPFGDRAAAKAAMQRLERERLTQSAIAAHAQMQEAAAPKPAPSKAPAELPRFGTETELVKVGTRQLGKGTVKTQQDLADATAYLARGAVERLDAIVTDAKGKVLAVIGAYKGTRDAASVYPEIIVAEAFGVPGAASVWLSHNHPSGVPHLSSADKRLAAAIAERFRGTQINIRGIMAIGAKDEETGVRRWSFADLKGQDRDYEPMQTGGGVVGAERKANVPVMEREYTKTGKIGPHISDSRSGASAVLQVAGKTPGIVLLDAQYDPIAFLPWTADRAKLRDTGALDELYRAVGKANAEAAIIANPDGHFTRAQVLNIAGGLQHGAGVKALDAFDYSTNPGSGPATSYGDIGKMEPRHDFYSKKRQAYGPKKFGTGPGQIPPSLKLDPEATAERIGRRLADNMNRVLKFQTAVEERRGSPIKDEENVYVKENLAKSQARTLADKIEEQYWNPILQAMKKNGLDLRTVDDFLLALHAKERNDIIASRNPKFPDGGSGMTNAEAAKILSSTTGAKRQALARIAQLVRDLHDTKLKMLEAHGVISHADANMLRTMYKHYVPLKTIDAEDTEQLTGQGRGLDIRGQEFSMAMGRGSRATSPLLVSFQDFGRSAIRAYKNDVGKALWTLAQDPATKGMVEIADPSEFVIRQPDSSGVIRESINPLWSQAEEIFATKVNGEPKYLIVRDEQLLEQLKRMGDQQVPDMLREVGAVTSAFGRLLTQYNPTFAPTNIIRDSIQASILSLSVPGLNPARVMGNIPSALWQGIIRGQGKLGQRYKEFLEDGGATNSYGLSEISDYFANIEAEGIQSGQMPATLRGKVGAKALKAKAWLGQTPIAKGLEMYNEAFENAVRLATYSAMRDNGVSRQKAAYTSKELSTNFNKKGEFGGVMNAAYVFTNATMQANRFLIKAAKNPKVRYAIAALVAAGVLQDLLGAALGGDDDETGEVNIDELNDFTLDHNLTFITDDKNQLKMPLPYGLNLPFVIGRRISKAIRTWGQTGRGASEILGILGAFTDTFSPIGGIDVVRDADGSINWSASSIKFFTPTLAKPLADIGFNSDFTGKPVYKEASGTAPPPHYLNAFRSASEAAKTVSKWLSNASGGDDIQPGFADVPPEVLDHLVGTYSGGLGRFVGQGVDIAMKAAGGELGDVETRNIPLANRFVGQDSPGMAYGRYRTISEQLDYDMKRAKDGQKLPAPRVQTLRLYRAVERELGRLRKERKDALKVNNQVRAQQLDKAEVAYMKRVIKSYGVSEAAK